MVDKSSISQAVATARFFARKPFPLGSIKTEVCPICKSNRIIRDFLGGNTRWCACISCKSYFSEYFPTQEEADAYYEREYRANETPDGDYPLQSHRRTHVLRGARQIALVMNVIRAYKTALDFGCALGWTVHCLQFMGLDAYGVERGEVDRQWSKKHLGLTLYKEIEEVPIQAFDVIVMSHVLEHFINPIERLADFVENHLNPGGRVIIEVPSHNAPSAWSAFHAVIFNTESLSHTLQEAGLRVEIVRSKETDPRYPVNLMWAVGRKPHEDDEDIHTEIVSPFTTKEYTPHALDVGQITDEVSTD